MKIGPLRTREYQNEPVMRITCTDLRMLKICRVQNDHVYFIGSSNALNAGSSNAENTGWLNVQGTR